MLFMVGPCLFKYIGEITLDQSGQVDVVHPGISGTPPSISFPLPHTTSSRLLSSYRSVGERVLILQDLEDGGIGDRPGDWVDVFHTVFGVAGQSSPLVAVQPPSSLLHLSHRNHYHC